MTTRSRLPLTDERARHVERELYYYYKTKAALTTRRALLAEGGDPGERVDLPRRRDAIAWSDPTSFRGTALAEDAQLREWGRIVGAVEETHARLPDELARCLELYYWSSIPAVEVAETLAISRPTLYRWREAIVSAVAARLGWA